MRTDVDVDTLSDDDVINGDGPERDAWERGEDRDGYMFAIEHKRPTVERAIVTIRNAAIPLDTVPQWCYRY